MITSETPGKLADIIRDTWPQLYRPPHKKLGEKNEKTNSPPGRWNDESR